MKCGKTRDEEHIFEETEIRTVFKCEKCEREYCMIDALKQEDIETLAKLITIPEHEKSNPV